MEVIKRSGEVVEFNPDKIYQAILKAAQVVYVLTDDLRQNLAQVTKKVAMDLDEAQVYYHCRTLHFLSLATRFGTEWLW